MLPQEQIDRINVLARKARTEGLTPQERDEQVLLRAAYLSSFKAQFRDILDSIEVIDGPTEE